MAGLKETTKWESEIYRIEENDPVHGGEEGISNKPIKQLANRTQYLKSEVEKRYLAQDASTTQRGLVQLDSSTDSNAENKAATPKAINIIKALVTEVRGALNNYIPNSKKSNNDNSTSSDTVATSYAIKKVRDIATTRATDVTAGQTVLSHKTNGTDKTKAATEFALNELNKELAGKGVPLGTVVAFPKNVTPRGFLRANGGKFNQATYPDLYVANGNSDILPNLNHSDVGMTVYFPFDEIPDGWIAFNSIRNVVTQQSYPELYDHLVLKYGSISNVPLAEDRFIRNAWNGLSVGQIQSDAIRNITGEIDLSPLGSGNQFLEFESSRNHEIFKGAILPNKAKWTYWTTDQNGGAETPRGFKFDASQVVPTADENRPKSIVLKLCIKARNSFDDVQFWIKAYGVVENAGSLDASKLAQDIQQVRIEKADVTHTHSHTDITDFKSGVANAYQHALQENGWRKSPDGFIEQWGKALLNAGSGGSTDTPVNFPIAFPNKVLNVVMSYAIMTDKRLTQDPVLTTLTNTSMTIRQYTDRNITVFWRAIGR
ncbi:tail fiber protein [Pasteurella oralis]|uniref:Tail fiber protein n=1 Tax=Pasteurella oralis TaxID=1071947 RepID=A0ABW4NSD8_9PAST